MIEWGCRTDAGRVRANNEDNFGCAPELDLYVLSDGMGGLQFGEVASRLAVDTILAHCREARRNSTLPLFGDPMDGVSVTSGRLASAIHLANQCIHQAAHGDADKQQMGATVVVVQFAAGRISFAHVGDSRIYRLRHDHLEQLTLDHSFVAEQVRQGHMTDDQAFVSNLQNVLTRALGVDPAVQPDVGEQAIEEDDTILLCSDGLTRELSDTQIAGILSEAEHAQEAADQLVTLANQAGGADNITAAVLRPRPRPVGAFGPIGRLGKWFKSR